MRKRISWISLVIFLILLLLSTLLMSVAGDRIGWYFVTGIFAIPPIIAGPKRYRVLGVIALIIAILTIIADYSAGKYRENKINETQQEYIEGGNLADKKIADFTLSVEQFEAEVDGKDVIGEMRTYKADLIVWDKKIEVTFDPDEIDGDLDKFVEGLYGQISWINKNRPVIEDSIIAELLELKNNVWLDETESPVSRKQFLETIVIDSVLFFDDSSFEIYFNDGDLFWGHTIIVDGSPDRKVESVMIAG